MKANKIMSVVAAASLALCAAMPTAAELSDQDEVVIAFFCAMAAAAGESGAVFSDPAIDADECKLAGRMLAEGSSPIIEFRHPTELWMHQAVETAIYLNMIVCSNRFESGYLTRYPRSNAAEQCGQLEYMLRALGLGE